MIDDLAGFDRAVDLGVLVEKSVDSPNVLFAEFGVPADVGGCVEALAEVGGLRRRIVTHYCSFRRLKLCQMDWS